MFPLFCFTMLPFINGDFDSANLTYKLNDPGLAWGGLQIALVWIWIMIWSTGAGGRRDLRARVQGHGA